MIRQYIRWRRCAAGSTAATPDRLLERRRSWNNMNTKPYGMLSTVVCEPRSGNDTAQQARTGYAVNQPAARKCHECCNTGSWTQYKLEALLSLASTCTESRYQCCARFRSQLATASVRALSRVRLQLPACSCEPIGQQHAKGTFMQPAPGSCCSECGSLTFSQEWLKAFGVMLCGQCRRDDPLISKANAKATYLLSDGDLARLGCLAKPNPQHSNWAPMKMYLSSQVEQVALTKHGSLEALADLRAARVSGRLQQRADKRRREQAAEEQAEALRVRLEMEAAAATRDAVAAADAASQLKHVEEVVDPDTGKRMRRYGSDAALAEVEEL